MGRAEALVKHMSNIIPLAKQNDKGDPQVRKWEVSLYFLWQKRQSYTAKAVDTERSED